MKTRAEHLQWCKNRALEYVHAGELQEAMSSMLSDLRKHPETADSLRIGFVIMVATDRNDPESVRRFIDGFN